MNIIKVFDSSFRKMREKNWDHIYVMVDLHGTIFKPSYEKNEKYEFYPDAKRALMMMSHDPEVKLILWTSTDAWFLREYLNVLEKNDIKFDCINSNPYEETTQTEVKSMSFKEKPYFNVGIDDKFGFDPETDWTEVYKWFTFLKGIY